MPKDTEAGTRARVMRVFRAILEHPKRYTLQDLALRHNFSPDTLRDDLKAIQAAGFEPARDSRQRYFFETEKPLLLKKAKELRFFSDEESRLLNAAIDSLPITPEQRTSLQYKLLSFYDYSRMGFANLRKPYLNKVNLLEKAKEEKKVVVLEGYHSSNSSQVSDRRVEPFHVVGSDDMLHAFDLEKKVIRHFRLTRFTRVRPTNQPWQYEGHHNVMKTDPFRIVNNQQVNVHLRLSVGAYNELLERYPLTSQYVQPTEDPNYFDFQADVNKNFFGLNNFILGFYHLDIQVLAPDSLREHLRAEVAKMKF